MRVKKVLAMVLTAALALAMVPVVSTEAASDITVTTQAGSGSLLSYFGAYVYYDYNYTTDTSTEIKSMVENSYVSGDTVGHIGHVASRDGYGFAGWAEKENGTPIDLTTYKITKSVKLFPVWSSDYSYITVAEGGRYVNGTFAIANGTSLKSMGLREAYDKRKGYSFKGFATKKNSTKTIDLDTYKVTDDVTLYPVYSGIGKTVKDDNGHKYKVKTFDGPYYINCELKAPKNKNVKQYVMPYGFYDSSNNYYYVDGIGKGAFKDCKKLNKVVLNSVNSIGASAFEGCDKLKEIAITGFYGNKKNCKNCFKGSSIKKIHTYEGWVVDFKKIFTKKNTGASGKVKIAGDFVGY